MTRDQIHMRLILWLMRYHKDTEWNEVDNATLRDVLGDLLTDKSVVQS